MGLSASSDTLVYFFSALPERDLSWHVAQCGAAGFLPKPFTIADIDKVLVAAGLVASRSRGDG